MVTSQPPLPPELGVAMRPFVSRGTMMPHPLTFFVRQCTDPHATPELVQERLRIKFSLNLSLPVIAALMEEPPQEGADPAPVVEPAPLPYKRRLSARQRALRDIRAYYRHTRDRLAS